MDHKPLLGLFITRYLDTISNLRLQKIRLKCSDYTFVLKWRPWKTHLIYDALSRAPLFCKEKDVCVRFSKVENDNYNDLKGAVTDMALKPLVEVTAKDAEYNELIEIFKERRSLKDLTDGHHAKQLQSHWQDISLDETLGLLLVGQ